MLTFARVFIKAKNNSYGFSIFSNKCEYESLSPFFLPPLNLETILEATILDDNEKDVEEEKENDKRRKGAHPEAEDDLR